MTDLRQRSNTPWPGEPSVLIESTDGSGSGPFGPPPWTVRAKYYTEHGMFARAIDEWNLSCFFSQNLALRTADSPVRAARRQSFQVYLDAIDAEAGAK